jgi:hypothetical protein
MRNKSLAIQILGVIAFISVFGCFQKVTDLAASSGTDTPAVEKMWMIGGEGIGSGSMVFSSPDGQSWSKVADFDSSVVYAAAVAFQGKMWLIGGYDGLSDLAAVQSSADGSTWTQESSLPEARSGHGAVVFDNRIWVVGGSSSATVFSSADGVSWTTEASLVYQRTYHGLLAFNSTLWTIGAVTGFPRQLQYSADGTSWSATGDVFPATPDVGRYAGSAVVFDGKMWWVGGVDQQPLSNSGNAAVHFSEDGTTWTQAGTIPGDRKFGCLLVFQDKLWQLGGVDENGATATTFHSVDGATWTAGGTLPESRQSAACVVL